VVWARVLTLLPASCRTISIPRAAVLGVPEASVYRHGISMRDPLAEGARADSCRRGQNERAVALSLCTSRDVPDGSTGIVRQHIFQGLEVAR